MRRYEHGGNVYGCDDIHLDFSININPLGMPEPVKQAITDHIPDYIGYPDPACSALSAALAARHGLAASMVLCGNGASELIFALCACVKPRRTLVLAPTFSEYERAATLFGGEVREHRLLEEDGFALTDSILAEITQETDMLFLCNPNNPTGRLASSSLICTIAEACLNSGVLLVLDECFMDFTRGESMLRQLRDYPNVLILQAFTKIYAMAGLRLGMLYCADGRRLSDIAKYMPTWSVSSVAQAAGLAALKDRAWIEATRRSIETERAYMTAALRELGLTVYQSDSNFLFMKSKRPLYAPLKERGILVRSCASFTGLDGRYLRIGLKTRDENTVLLSAVSEVLNG